MIGEQILYSLYQSYAYQDHSLENQKKVLELAVEILRIQAQVQKEGLGAISQFQSGFPMLDRGLQLVVMGTDPDVIKSVLFRTLLAGHIDLLTGLVIMEGTWAIQTGQSLFLTKELLKSYFTFELGKELEEEYVKSGLDKRDTKPIFLNDSEMQQLLGSVNKEGEEGELSQQEISQLLTRSYDMIKNKYST